MLVLIRKKPEERETWLEAGRKDKSWSDSLEHTKDRKSLYARECWLLPKTPGETEGREGEQDLNTDTDREQCRTTLWIASIFLVESDIIRQ